MTDNDNTFDNSLYNTDQRRRGMATRARTREDTSGNNGTPGLEGGSLSAVIPGSKEAPRALSRGPLTHPNLTGRDKGDTSHCPSQRDNS